MVRIDEKVPSLMPQQNPLQKLQAKFKGMENGFRAWLAKLSLPVEASVETTAGAVGASMGTLINNNSSFIPTHFQASLNPQSNASFKQAQARSGAPLELARSIGPLRGLDAGISRVVKRLIAQEDLQSRMLANFGFGVVLGYVIPLDGISRRASAVGLGVLCTYFQLRIHQPVKFQPPPVQDDKKFSRTKSILNSLGLQKYEENFKRGVLTDSTLPLLTERSLKDVRIPPGHRLLILDQIQRDTAMREKQGRCAPSASFTTMDYI